MKCYVEICSVVPLNVAASRICSENMATKLRVIWGRCWIVAAQHGIPTAGLPSE